MYSYAEFFEHATGHPPYAYQQRLADNFSSGGILQVPTGAGKTAAAVLGWLWNRSVARRESTPRRLVYCLPMRTLVRQTRDAVILWLYRLGLLSGDATFNGRQLSAYTSNWGNDDAKVSVVLLMGGEAEKKWREYPENSAILIGTQDMLLSSAINRGYAVTPRYWPVDFGLINVDAFWVMDEIQLMGPARTTSVQLQIFADESHGKQRYGFMPRRTLWMSATAGIDVSATPSWVQTPEWRAEPLTISLIIASEDDYASQEFGRVWKAPKKLEIHMDGEPGSEETWTVSSQQLIDRIEKEAKSGSTILVFVNTVARARTVFDTLRARLPVDVSASLLHSRFRPRDRIQIERSVDDVGPSSGRIIISTQVLEAGVDLNAQVLFTEVCPWPALVQRLGRLNRRGNLPPTTAVVFEAEVEHKSGETNQEFERRRALPYLPEHIEVGRKNLRELQANGGDLSPCALAQIDAPLEIEGPVLRRFDLDDFFDTDADIAGGHTDAAPFVRALDRELDAYILWRDLKKAPELQPPVHPDELCAVPFYEARKAFAGCDTWILTFATTRRRDAAWRLSSAGDISAGDTVMVDLSTGCYTEEVGWLGTGNSNSRPVIFIDTVQPLGGQAVRAWTDAARTVIVPIDSDVDGPHASDADPRSFKRQWMELGHHLREAEKQERKLVGTLAITEPIAKALCTAARWHDVGKALERGTNGSTYRPFQKMLRDRGHEVKGEPRADTLYAKSNGLGGNAGFRHEVASALVYLNQSDAEDLVAYLIMAHHGKVRLQPAPWDEDDPRDANGVRLGDRIAAAALPNGLSDITLDPETFLSSLNHLSWQGRVRELLDKLGPFRLAYLEALVQIGDWRAS